MTNKQLIEKLKEDMEMRGFSHHTKDSYLRKAKEVVEYFKKTMRQEVPINFYRDKRNKKSNLKTIRDGIRHLKIILKG